MCLFLFAFCCLLWLGGFGFSFGYLLAVWFGLALFGYLLCRVLLWLRVVLCFKLLVVCCCVGLSVADCGCFVFVYSFWGLLVLGVWFYFAALLIVLVLCFLFRLYGCLVL